jgi:hypothetical protein
MYARAEGEYKRERIHVCTSRRRSLKGRDLCAQQQKEIIKGERFMCARAKGCLKGRDICLQS